MKKDYPRYTLRMMVLDRKILAGFKKLYRRKIDFEYDLTMHRCHLYNHLTDFTRHSIDYGTFHDRIYRRRLVHTIDKFEKFAREIGQEDTIRWVPLEGFVVALPSDWYMWE